MRTIRNSYYIGRPEYFLQDVHVHKDRIKLFHPYEIGRTASEYITIPRKTVCDYWNEDETETFWDLV